MRLRLLLLVVVILVSSVDPDNIREIRQRAITVQGQLSKYENLNITAEAIAQLVKALPSKIKSMIHLTTFTVTNSQVLMTSYNQDGKPQQFKKLLELLLANNSLQECYLVYIGKLSLYSQSIKQGGTMKQLTDHQKTLEMLPAFVWHLDFEDSVEKNKFLLPPECFFTSEHNSTVKQGLEGRRKYNWVRKYGEQLFWRGEDPMNDNYLSQKWDNYRKTLVALSSQYPIDINARFYCPWYKLFSVLTGGCSLQYSITQQTWYRYLIAIDGLQPEIMKIMWIALSGSSLIIPQSTRVVWFSSMMEPYKHYYPTKADFSEILDTIDLLNSDFLQARQIANYAFAFAKTYLSQQSAKRSFDTQITDFQRLQKSSFTDLQTSLIEEYGVPLEEQVDLSDNQLEELRTFTKKFSSYLPDAKIILAIVGIGLGVMGYIKFKQQYVTRNQLQIDVLQ